MKVSFLIAGNQKCATSALHYYLQQHDDLFLPDNKELHFFDNENIDWSEPPYDSNYHAAFKTAPTTALYGEATPIYTWWPKALDRIRKYNPKIKLIVSLRDPVMRAYSHWRMEFARNAETLGFSEAIREGRQRIATNDHHRVFSYVERGFYAEKIWRLFQLFPSEQLLFLTVSELRNRPNDVFDEICGFLGVSNFKTHPTPKVIFSQQETKTLPPSTQDISYLRKIFCDNITKTETLIGKKIEIECK